jgi:hypothetical protein
VGLFTELIDDAALLSPGGADPARAVAEHRRHRAAWYADLVGPLVVPDHALVAVGRVAGAEPVAVRVVASGGAGGLTALARRTVSGVRVVAVETALRDLDGLSANAARVVAAAAELDPEIRVHVELPYAPGWVGAVEEVEAAGLFGQLRTGGTELTGPPPPRRLAEQLSVLVEADLGFTATGGLEHPWPSGDAEAPYGFLTVMMALDALIDGMDVTEAEELLRSAERRRLAAAVEGWDDGARQRIRRRLRSLASSSVAQSVEDLVELGLLTEPG